MKSINEYFTKNEIKMFNQFHANHIEMRGVWHMPHTLNFFGYDERTYEGVIKLLDAIKNAGFNTIFIETTVKARSIYPSNVATIHPDFIFHDNRFGDYGNDYFLCFIEEAHKRDLSVHAWTSTMRAGRFDNSLEESLPSVMKEEWLSRGFHNEFGKDGRFGMLMWMDPTNPEVVEYLLHQYEELIENYSIDGVELDAIRYPISNLLKATSADALSDFGYTTTAIDAFAKQYHFIGDFKKEIVAHRAVRLDWIRFRVLTMTNLVEKIRELVLRVKPDMLFSAAVLRGTEVAYEIACQDWATWVKNDWFDFITPMAYTIDNELIAQSFDETEILTQNKMLNLQGIASIIEGGNFINHFEQMDLINKKLGFGSILFSIRQLLKDEKTSAMVAYVNHRFPAISPLAPLQEISSFLFKDIEKYELSKAVQRLWQTLLVFSWDKEDSFAKATDLVDQLMKKTEDKDLQHRLLMLQKLLIIRLK